MRPVQSLLFHSTFCFSIGKNDSFLMIMTYDINDIPLFDLSFNEGVAHSRSHKNSFFLFFPPSFMSPSKAIQWCFEAKTTTVKWLSWPSWMTAGTQSGWGTKEGTPSKETFLWKELRVLLRNKPGYPWRWRLKHSGWRYAGLIWINWGFRQ